MNHQGDATPFNDTNISLIPKIKHPVSIKDYRPIGLCNAIYNLMSKTVVNRPKPYMSSITHDSQSSFV